MSAPFDELARRRRVLEEGLALLDGAAFDDPEIPDALGRLVEALAEGPDPGVLRDDVPASEQDRFDDEAWELVRLNAVLTSAVQRDRDAIVERLGSARAALKTLRHQGAPRSEGAGGRCDVSG